MQRCERAGDALGPEQHERDEQQAEIQHPGVGQRADHVARDQEHEDADHRSPEADEAAADQRHHHDVAGLVQAHHIGERASCAIANRPPARPESAAEGEDHEAL